MLSKTLFVFIHPWFFLRVCIWYNFLDIINIQLIS